MHFIRKLPLKVAWKLQLIQNEAARLLSGAGYRDWIITPALEDLYYQTVGFLAQYKVQVLVLKVLNGSDPGYSYRPANQLLPHF